MGGSEGGATRSSRRSRAGSSEGCRDPRRRAWGRCSLRLPHALSGQLATVLAMARVLVTGMSGAGKTTLLDELRRRGHLTVDTDFGGWELPDGTWDEQRMDRLLATHPHVVVSGTVDNQGRFYDRFEHVVLLSAPLHVLLLAGPHPAEQPVRQDNRAAGRDGSLPRRGRAAPASKRQPGARRTTSGC